MATDLAMNTWVVTYNDYMPVSNTPTAVRIKVQAAYYAPEGHLVEFKDTDHQVVFALHAGIISTIRRGDVVTEPEPVA